MTACLVVDHHELRELTGQRLAGDGMRIRMACTVQSCRESLAKGGIDIVLLDLQLPDGDGIEVCRKIRGNMNKVDLADKTN